MNRIKLLIFTGLLLLVVSSVPAEEGVTFTEPVLLTSCGQSADALMVKALLTKEGMSFLHVPAAMPADLKDVGSIMLVAGGSAKGLGAAKISTDDEIARVTALLDSAAELKIPVLTMHVGGSTRRGALSEPFNKLSAERADRIVVVKGGNDDGFFTRIAAEREIPLDSAETIFAVSEILQTLYPKDVETDEK